MLNRPLLRAAQVSLLAGGLFGAAVGLLQANETWSEEVSELRRDTLLSLDTVDLLLQSIRLAANTVATGIDPDDLAGSAEALWPLVERDWLKFRTVLVVDPSGIVVADQRDGAPTIGLDVSDRAYFQQVMAGNATPYFLSEPIASRIDGNWALPVSVPVLDADGTLHGVVVVGVGRDFFDPGQWQALGPDAKVFMAAVGSGSVVALNDRAEAADVRATIEASLSDEAVLQAGSVIAPLAIPGQIAFMSTSTSGRLEVVVSRSRASIGGQAIRAGVLAGGLAAIVVSLITLFGLQGRETIKHVRRDAERLRLLEERQRLAADAAKIGVWDFDVTNGVLTWDPIMHNLHGTTPEQFSGTFADWQACVHPDDLAEVEEHFRQSLKTGEDFNQRFRIVTPAGQERVIAGRAGIELGTNGKARRVVGVNYEITKEIKREKALEAARDQIEYEAFHDPLTHVGNRRGVSYHLKTIRTQYARDVPVALLMIDLDRFKYINDVFGHAGGDHLLRVVAGILTSIASSQDYVARLGGDEFAIILSGADAEFRATAMGERILEACRTPTLYQRQKIHFSTSIGLCVGAAAKAEALLEDADIALYQAKNEGRNRLQVFTHTLREHAEEKKHLSDDLADALKSDQIGVRLQPQVCSRTGRILGAEALVRWWHPKRGELGPAQFLPLAEEMGLLNTLDGLVLRKAVEASVALAKAGARLPSVSVNVSFERLIHPDFLDDVDSLPEHPCPITFELLETIDFDTVAENILARIEALRTRGISIAIDDFGSGRASITTLLKVRPDRVKIDKQLVINGMTHDGTPSPLLQAIADMCQRLDIPMTAEGVETADSASMMARLGCDMLQGYHYAKPLTTNAFAEWAKTVQPALR